MMRPHRHVDTRWEFGRDGALAYCRDCKQWRTIFETGFDASQGRLLGPWPNPPEGSFQYQMDELRRKVSDLGWAILDAARIPELVAWLNILVLRCRLRWKARRLESQIEDLTVGQVDAFLKEIDVTEEEFKSIRRDV